MVVAVVVTFFVSVAVVIVNIQPTPVYSAVSTVTALTAQGMTIMRLFVLQVIVITTHGDTQYSVNKKIKKILNLTSSGERNY